ncbi:hypothetical protein FB451DRAFT_1463786 [Mycena latifolia]|nr:hypothetical protein FB451DRAFT_1463786 [Mycena latifolia]
MSIGRIFYLTQDGLGIPVHNGIEFLEQILKHFRIVAEEGAVFFADNSIPFRGNAQLPAADLGTAADTSSSAPTTMPVSPGRNKGVAKAEARYNVTTDLGLHSAAATGNVGLVEYTLARGQPINSVLGVSGSSFASRFSDVSALDDVLPLHLPPPEAMSASYRSLSISITLQTLPRHYSNDESRDPSVPIIGTNGSTPLHFAAANINGNTSIVIALLLRGAHANRADKHGITPEMLARQNGWDECADLLKSNATPAQIGMDTARPASVCAFSASGSGKIPSGSDQIVARLRFKIEGFRLEEDSVPLFAATQPVNPQPRMAASSNYPPSSYHTYTPPVVAVWDGSDDGYSANDEQDWTNSLPDRPSWIQMPLTHSKLKDEPKKTENPAPCLMCQEVQATCDGSRPCQRCAGSGLSGLCIDAPKKAKYISEDELHPRIRAKRSSARLTQAQHNTRDFVPPPK